MKVRELIDQLRECNDEAEVVLQIDPEGNGYRPVRGADPDGIVDGQVEHQMDEVYDASWSAADALMEEAEWESFKADNPRVTIIFP